MSFRLKDCTENTNNTYYKSHILLRYCKTWDFSHVIVIIHMTNISQFKGPFYHCIVILRAFYYWFIYPSMKKFAITCVLNSSEKNPKMKRNLLFHWYALDILCESFRLNWNENSCIKSPFIPIWSLWALKGEIV